MAYRIFKRKIGSKTERNPFPNTLFLKHPDLSNVKKANPNYIYKLKKVKLVKKK